MKSKPGPFGEYLTAGGMFTLVRVRDNLISGDDPGWYHHPPGTMATLARAGDLARDGIDLAAPVS